MYSLARHELVHTYIHDINMLHNDRSTYIHSSKCFGSFSPPHSALQPDVHLTNHIGNAQRMCFAVFPVSMKDMRSTCALHYFLYL